MHRARHHSLARTAFHASPHENQHSSRGERRECYYGQLPPDPAAIGFLVEPQISSHFAPEPQLNEHDPVQVIVHVESAAHVTLLLSPTVAEQLAFDPQPMLHDAPQVPPQVDDSEQFREQLLAFWHDPNEHDVPEGQLQLVPVQLAGGGPLG